VIGTARRLIISPLCHPPACIAHAPLLVNTCVIAVLAALENIAEPQQTKLANWLDPFLAHWPDHSRILPEPWPWLPDLFESGRIPSAARLCRTLRWTEGQITAECAAALANAEPLLNIAILTLDNHPLGAHGGIALAKSPYLQSLRVLSLRDTQLTSAGVAALANSTVLQCVKKLDLSRNGIGLDGVLALARSSHLTNLSDLRITFAFELNVDRLGMNTLLFYRHMPALKKLITLPSLATLCRLLIHS